MKKEHLNLYTLDMRYVRALAAVDEKVMSVSPQEHKENRPFVGIIVVCDGKKYCVPLTSPKPKHEKMKNDLDFSKIYDGRGKLVGALNFNNMIPVSQEVISLIDPTPNAHDTPQQRAYKELLNNQWDWCNKNAEAITHKARKLYKFVTQTPEKSRNLTRRCCDFLTLEAVLERYVARKAQKQQGEAYIESLSPEQAHYLRLSEKAMQVLQQDGSIPMVVKKSEGEYLAKIALADKPSVDRLLDHAVQIARKKKQ